MNPLPECQLERQTIILPEEQQQGRKHEEPKDSETAHEQPSGISAHTPSSKSSSGADKRRKKVNQLNDGLALQIAHTKLLHPTPVVAMKYSSILETIDKLETLSDEMDPTSDTMVQSDEDKRSNLPTPESHVPLEIGHSPKVNPLSPPTAPSAIILYESDSTHQHMSLSTNSPSTPVEPAAAAATVIAHPSRASVSPQPPSTRAASTASTINSLFSRSATSSTRSRSRYSILNTHTSVPVVSSSRLRTSSSAHTMDKVSIGCSDNRECEQVGNARIPMVHADERQQEQRVSKTRDDRPNSRRSVGAEIDANTFPVIHSTSTVSLSAESSPHNKTSRPPMAPRALSFFKKKPSLYTHQSMAQSDSHIDQPAPCSITDIGSSNKRQSSSVLASISSTFLGIGSSLRSRNHSNTSSVSLATIRSSTAVNDSVAIKSHNQTAQITCVLTPSTSITSVSNASANVPNVRSFSNIFNTGRQHPMSTPSHSLSTPTLPSFNQPNQANEPLVVRRTGCTCHNKQFPGPCLFHKKLPSIPVAQLEDQDATGSIKEKKSSRVSAMFTTVSIRSFIASMKKSRLQSTSVQSLVEINPPSSKELQVRSPSNTSLPSIHPQEPTLNHTILLSHTPHKNRTGPSSTVYRAKKRPAAADVPLTGSPESSMDQLGLQQVKRQAIYGLKERSLVPSNHGSEQSHPCADRLYLCPISDSTPGSAPLYPFTKATTSDKDMIRRVPAITRIRQAAESAPNLSLHGGTHVSAVNVQAELIGHSHIAEASTTSRRGGLNSIANSTPDLPSTAHSRSLIVPAPSAYSTEPYNKENATFFEPFQAYSHIHGGQASRYVSFHFDLSHLEKTENDAESDLTLATKADMDHPEQATVVEGEDGEEEYEIARRVSSLPRPPPPRSIPHEADKEDCLSNGDEEPFQTLHQHFRSSSRFATVSNPSLHLPSQPRSDQQTAVKRFFGYGGNDSMHRGHYESRPGAQGTKNSSTVSLPAMLSSFLSPSASTTSLPLHSNQTHLSTEPRLTDRRSRLSGSKWSWMWWKNGKKVL